MKLKEYQDKTLTALETFLTKAKLIGASKAFAETAQPVANGIIPNYHPLPEMEEIPYICLRLPTGGGKTILATRSIAIAGRTFLETEYPLVLWLVPTTTIAEQTLDCLRNHDHPYREAINEKYGASITIKSISDFDSVRADDLENRLCILVGTFAALRVKETDDRNI